MNFQVVLTSCLRGTQTHKRSLELSQAKIKKKKKKMLGKKRRCPELITAMCVEKP